MSALPFLAYEARSERDFSNDNSLGVIFLNRKSNSDIRVGLSHLEHAASGGIAIAQLGLGKMATNGQIVPKDLLRAFQLFHRAALGGSIEAMDSLAWCYYKGEGTPKDISESSHWFKLASDAGHAGSLCMMGALAADGILPGAGMREAANYFQAGYAAGDTGAANHLGALFSDQRFDTFNPGLAIHWYTTYGRTGKADGFHLAAQIILNADGKLDHLGDVRWLLASAADLGDMQALLQLANLMENAHGGPKGILGGAYGKLPGDERLRH
ncbi:MAG: sel1 repeat family protein [Burkholderiales bacterium]|nr:sel1 repeat family protein [Burkholderiales bacterium]